MSYQSASVSDLILFLRLSQLVVLQLLVQKLTLAGEGVDDLFLDTLLSLRETLVLSNRHFLFVCWFARE